MTTVSLYPITQLYFECSGCKTRWMVRPYPVITRVEEFKAFMDGGGSGPCPRDCGAKTVSVVFRAPSTKPDEGERVDPFTIFDKVKEGK